MALRPVRAEEKALIQHLLSLVKQGSRFSIPEQVENINSEVLGGIQLSSRGEHTEDLVEAEYKDSDGRDVLITLSSNQYGELFDLDLWKVDFSAIKRYPEPNKVKRST